LGSSSGLRSGSGSGSGSGSNSGLVIRDRSRDRDRGVLKRSVESRLNAYLAKVGADTRETPQTPDTPHALGTWADRPETDGSVTGETVDRLGANMAWS